MSQISVFCWHFSDFLAVLFIKATNQLLSDAFVPPASIEGNTEDVKQMLRAVKQIIFNV